VPSGRAVSNPLALAVLYLLRERPMHPYEMSRTLRTRHKERSIRLNYGSLYAVVDKLLAHELIAEQETVRTGRRPERTVYRITRAGQRELEDWLADLLSTPVKEYTQFEAGLSLIAALPPEDVAALLDQRCESLEAELATGNAAMRELLTGLDRLHLIELEYTLLLRQVELDWTRRLAEEIRTGALDGVDEWRTWHSYRADSPEAPDAPHCSAGSARSDPPTPSDRPGQAARSGRAGGDAGRGDEHQPDRPDQPDRPTNP
jgi:DNA-binding PadR family transcriptional regulator